MREVCFVKTGESIGAPQLKQETTPKDPTAKMEISIESWKFPLARNTNWIFRALDLEPLNYAQ